MKVHASSVIICVMAVILHAASARSVHFHNTTTVWRISGSHRYATARPSATHEASIAHAAAQPDDEPASSTPNGPWTRSSSDSVWSADITPISTASSAPISSATSVLTFPLWADPPLQACWASHDCLDVIDDFISSWDVAGINLADRLNRGPGGLNETGSAFAVYFCKIKHYDNVISNSTVGPATPMKSCLKCFEQAGVDMKTQHNEVIRLTSEIVAFCNTQPPNLLRLLVRLLAFMQSLGGPEEFNNKPLTVTAVVASLVSDQLTRSSSSDQRTSSDSDQRTSSTSWWQTRLTPGMPIPTAYIAQLPLNWPYTAYNTAGKITSWPFVHPNATSQTVAWLYHSLLHNPRPIFTPKAHRSEVIYNLVLADWKHSFTDHTTPAPKTTGDTSRPPFEPTITQSAILPLDPDSDAERKSQDGLGTKPAAAGPDGPSATALVNLLSEVASMKSVLDMRVHIT